MCTSVFECFVSSLLFFVRLFFVRLFFQLITLPLHTIIAFKIRSVWSQEHYGHRSPFSTTFGLILSAFWFPNIITINRFNVVDRLSFFFKIRTCRNRKSNPNSIWTFNRFVHIASHYHNLFISTFTIRCKSQMKNHKSNASPSVRKTQTQSPRLSLLRQPKHIAL